jgi:hypothetical protein
MTDQLTSLVGTAGITLLITILWALMLAFAYWDIQRRKQAGRQIHTLAWMAAVACLPMIGLAAYLIARHYDRTAIPDGQDVVKPARWRETKYKMQPDARKPQAPIQVSDYTKETVLSQQYSNQQDIDRLAAAQFLFSVSRGPDLGKRFPVSQFPAQIGRDFDSVIRLDQDMDVSRKHALIYQISGSLRIRDLASTHGTRVNGEAITDQILNPGDRIEVGQTSLNYHIMER